MQPIALLLIYDGSFFTCTGSLVLLMINSCQAGDHYCQIGYTLEIDMTARDHQVEQVIPKAMPSDSIKNSSKFTECRWQLNFPALTKDRQVVIQGQEMNEPTAKSADGCNSTMANDAGSLHFEVSWPDDLMACRNKSKPTKTQMLRAGLFKVLTVTDRRTKISVWFARSSRNPKCERSYIILRAMTPLPGFCSRDMLSFRDRCYTVSSVNQSVTEALSSLQGDAQLATFSSLSEIRELIAANEARLLTYPRNKPLNLGRPLRLGIFQCGTDSSLLSVVRSGDKPDCYRLHVLSNPEEFKSHVQTHTGCCASLFVGNNSKTVSIQFEDCSESMPSLISFPVVADPNQSGTCNAINCETDLLLEEVRKLIDNNSGLQTEPVLRAPLIFIGVVLAALLILFISFCLVRKFLRDGEASGENLEQPEQIPMKSNSQEDEV